MKSEKIKNLVGWIGAGSGVLGAMLLSLNITLSGWGFILYLISSLTLMIWSVATKAWHQFAMQVCFAVINIIGIYNWLIR